MGREKREEQVKLVKKYFQREKQVTDRLQDKIVAKAEKLQKQYEVRSHSETRADTRITREEALRQGEARRQEALQRRQEFLKQESEQKVKKTTVGMSQKEKMQFQQESKKNWLLINNTFRQVNSNQSSPHQHNKKRA